MAKQNEVSKGERTRKTILNAAYGLIIEQGYAATSMRQIAEKAELSLGSIYNHFSAKEDVFRSIMQELHPFLEIMPILNSVHGETVEVYVRNAAHALIDQLGNHVDFLNLMLTEIVEFQGQHVPLMFEKIFPKVLFVAQRMAALEGKMRHIPAPVIARAFLGMFFSYYITGILLGPVMPPEMQANALDHFVDIFLHGILIQEKA